MRLHQYLYWRTVTQVSVVQNCIMALNLKQREAVCWKTDQEQQLSDHQHICRCCLRSRTCTSPAASPGSLRSCKTTEQNPMMLRCSWKWTLRSVKPTGFSVGMLLYRCVCAWACSCACNHTLLEKWCSLILELFESMNRGYRTLPCGLCFLILTPSEPIF